MALTKDMHVNGDLHVTSDLLIGGEVAFKDDKNLIVSNDRPKIVRTCPSDIPAFLANDTIYLMVDDYDQLKNRPLHESYRPYIAEASNASGRNSGVFAAWVRDVSGNGNHARVYNNAYRPLLQSSPGGSLALHFDGVDDYLEIAHSPSLDFAGKSQITLEAWVATDDTQTDGHWAIISRYTQFLLGFNNNSNGQVGGLVYAQNDLWQPANYFETADYGTGTANYSQWNHFAFSYDAHVGTARMYLNGLLVATFINIVGPIKADTGPIHIGHHEISAIGTRHMNAFISDVRIWDVSRTANQIQANFNKRLRGDEPGLKGYWYL